MLLITKRISSRLSHFHHRRHRFSMSPPRRRSSSLSQFRELLDKSRYIVALTGAGISAESGVPTFRGAGGLWRQYKSQELANPEAFKRDPSLVWQFYEYRRQLVSTKEPNPAHKALATLQNRFQSESTGRVLQIVTQNVDELHSKAGATEVVELHGNLFKTRCTKCGHVRHNYDIPIVASLKDISMDPGDHRSVPLGELPRCSKCNSLLRPHIVWFGESLDHEVFQSANRMIDNCDLLLVIGTSSVVYPAALFAPRVAQRNVPVVEFNLEETVSSASRFFFKGPCGETLPKALQV